MALAVNSFVEHAVIDRMNKQFLKVTDVMVMFRGNNCMQCLYGVFCADAAAADLRLRTALLLMKQENQCLCLYGGILPP